MGLRDKRLAKIQRLKDKISGKLYFYILSSLEGQYYCDFTDTELSHYLLLRQYPCHPANQKYILEILSNFPGAYNRIGNLWDFADEKRLLRYLDAMFKYCRMNEIQRDISDITKVITEYRY